MSGKINVLFYPKKSDTDIDGMVTVYARITVNGKRSELSLGRRVEEQRWNSRGGKLQGTTMEVSKFNRFLDTVKNRCFEIHDTLLREHLDVSATIIMNSYLGKEGKEFGIKNNHTHHLARHTFTTTVILANGVPIESV